MPPFTGCIILGESFNLFVPWQALNFLKVYWSDCSLISLLKWLWHERWKKALKTVKGRCKCKIASLASISPAWTQGKVCRCPDSPAWHSRPTPAVCYEDILCPAHTHPEPRRPPAPALPNKDLGFRGKFLQGRNQKAFFFITSQTMRERIMATTKGC